MYSFSCAVNVQYVCGQETHQLTVLFLRRFSWKHRKGENSLVLSHRGHSNHLLNLSGTVCTLPLSTTVGLTVRALGRVTWTSDYRQVVFLAAQVCILLSYWRPNAPNLDHSLFPPLCLHCSTRTAVEPTTHRGSRNTCGELRLYFYSIYRNIKKRRK